MALRIQRISCVFLLNFLSKLYTIQAWRRNHDLRALKILKFRSGLDFIFHCQAREQWWPAWTLFSNPYWHGLPIGCYNNLESVDDAASRYIIDFFLYWHMCQTGCMYTVRREQFKAIAWNYRLALAEYLLNFLFRCSILAWKAQTQHTFRYLTPRSGCASIWAT